MNKHFALWMVVGGLAVDLVDMLTTKKGETGGMLYGANGYLKGLSFGKVTVGEGVAMVGAAILFLKD